MEYYDEQFNKIVCNSTKKLCIIVEDSCFEKTNIEETTCFNISEDTSMNSSAIERKMENDFAKFVKI